MWYKITHWFGASYNPVDDHSITGYYDKLCELLYGDEDEEKEKKSVSVENIILQEESTSE